MKPPEVHYWRPYLFGWVALLVLLVIQIVLSRVLHFWNAAPFFGLLMAGVVAYTFMDLRRSNNLTRVFAIAGVLWMAAMLGLGVLDPATREQPGVQARTTDWRKPVTGPGGS